MASFKAAQTEPEWMKLIVGLGNPGRAYEETKHNIGFWVVDAFARQQHLTFSAKKGDAQISRGFWSANKENLDFFLVKPQTFMNRSGRSVRALLHYYKIPSADLILIFDDLDLNIGRVRLKKQGGSGGHRGVASVIQEVGTDQFSRIKIGIGKNHRSDASDYVLSPFQKNEKERVLESVEKSVALLPLLIEGQSDAAMNAFNAP